MQFIPGPLTVEWEGLQANIVRPDVQATNGIIHVIDRVMMKRRDLTKSGTVSWCPSAMSLISLLLFVFIKAKL
ncbi:fasciclin-1 [Trichonephila clavipes]|uniref:Fasciclin-1 n=1 Tax=Trichonephila clavipes TaxID=2585209 RepID=A0A8X6SYZ1_TRICX|nr:fasciclin-1 [Trichonephila clavipes]